MTPCGLHDPSAPVGASQIFVGGPPATSILWSLPPAKNPRYRESGDQKGRVVPSVPGSGCAASALRGRTQIWVLPSASVALKASVWPSGEIRGVSIEETFGGTGISKRTRR